MTWPKTSLSPYYVDPAFGWAFSMKTLYDLFYNFQLQNSLTDMGYTVRPFPLVHFSAQPKPFLSVKSTKTTQRAPKKLITSASTTSSS